MAQQPSTVEEFQSEVGETFDLSYGRTRVVLTLIRAERRGTPRDGSRPPFALLFHGPITPLVPQATYRFDHPRLGAFDMFIVPVGPDGESMQYEAIFN